MSRFKKWDVVLVAIILISLICVIYAHVIFLDDIFVKRDIGRYYRPLRMLIRQQFEAGGFPFWNPYLFCGLPLFATLQSCALYPLSIIYYLGDFSRMFNVFILAHLFLAGLFMYLLMRDLRLSKLASFFAAFTFAFSGYMISAINLTISLCGAAWFPLLLYFYVKKKAVYSALVLLMMFLAGDPAITVISIIILGCISAYFFLEDLIEKRKFNIKSLSPLFITVILFLLLSAFQTLPFLEFLKLTDRKGMPWWVASGWSVPASDLISLVIPFFNDINWYFGDYWQVQTWLDNYYIGLIPLGLCLVGAFFDKSKKTGLLIIFSVFALLLALGKYTSAYPLLYKFFPLFKLIRYPVRFFFLFTFSIAALSAIGLDYFRNNIKTDARLKKFARGLLVVSFLAALALVLISVFSGPIFVKLWNKVVPLIQNGPSDKKIPDLYIYLYTAFYNFKRALLLFTAFGLLFFLGTKKNVRRRSVCLVFIGIAVCDIVATNPKYEMVMDAKSYGAPSENVKFLQKDKSLFRIAVSPGMGKLHTRLPEKTYWEGILAAKDRLTSNRMIEYGIYDIGGYDSMYLDRQNKLLGALCAIGDPADTRILDMLNVKYICVASIRDKRRRGYVLAHSTPVASLYRNLNWMGRAYLADKQVIIKNEDKIMEKLKDKAFNPRKEVILEEGAEIVVANNYSPLHHPYKEDVQIISYKPNKVMIKASANSPKFLVLADSYYPGWKAYLDNKPTKIYRADYILRAVYIAEPGEHTVKFVYSPFSFKLGLGITLLGAVLAGLICKTKFLC